MTHLTDHAKQEIVLLTGIAEDVQRGPAERAKALLTAHQRWDVGGCLCGWAELGKSHAGHLVDELARAGLLATDLRTYEGPKGEHSDCAWGEACKVFPSLRHEFVLAEPAPAGQGAQVAGETTEEV